MAPDQVTRCPHCQTAFRVRPEQLAQAQGWLRCGQCLEPFDSTGLVVPWVPDTQETARVDVRDLLQTQDRGESPMPSSAVADGGDALLAFEQALATFPGRPDAAAPDEASPQADAALPVMALPAESAGPERRGVWIGWSVLLTLLLVVQLGWLARGWWWHAPSLGSSVQAWCASLGCVVPAGRDPGQLRIESSRFVADEAGHRLEWVLHNKSPWPVRMPAIELTLTGDGDAVLVRRVLVPAEVAAPERLSPGQTWEGRLRLIPEGGLAVIAYRLRIFYP